MGLGRTGRLGTPQLDTPSTPLRPRHGHPVSPAAHLPTCPPRREICKAAYQKIQDLRAELDAQWAAYKEQNALFRVQLAEDRKRRQEEYLKQKAERDAERAGVYVCVGWGGVGGPEPDGQAWGRGPQREQPASMWAPSLSEPTVGDRSTPA